MRTRLRGHRLGVAPSRRLEAVAFVRPPSWRDAAWPRCDFFSELVVRLRESKGRSFMAAVCASASMESYPPVSRFERRRSGSQRPLSKGPSSPDSRGLFNLPPVHGACQEGWPRPGSCLPGRDAPRRMDHPLPSREAAWVGVGGLLAAGAEPQKVRAKEKSRSGRRPSGCACPTPQITPRASPRPPPAEHLHPVPSLISLALTPVAQVRQVGRRDGRHRRHRPRLGRRAGLPPLQPAPRQPDRVEAQGGRERLQGTSGGPLTRAHGAHRGSALFSWTLTPSAGPPPRFLFLAARRRRPPKSTRPLRWKCAPWPSTSPRPRLRITPASRCAPGSRPAGTLRAI